MKQTVVIVVMSYLCFMLGSRDGLSSVYAAAPKVYTIDIAAKNPRIIQDYSKFVSVGIRLSNGSILSVQISEEELAIQQPRSFTIPPDLTIESCSFTWTLGNLSKLFFRPDTLQDAFSGDCLVDLASNQIIVSAGDFDLYNFRVNIDQKALSRFDSMYLSMAAQPKCGKEVMTPLANTVFQGSVDNDSVMQITLEVLCQVSPTLEVQFLNLKTDGSIVDETHNYSLGETIHY